MSLLSTFASEPLVALMAVLALVVSIGFHEFCHVLVASSLGDPTGRAAGRLTLNPLRHLDPFGFVAIVLFGIGWGRPAPFNPELLRYRRAGPAMVALGGPLSNLFLVGVFSLVWRLVSPSLGSQNLLTIFLTVAITYNAALAVFNLLPIPPLDGSYLVRAIFGPSAPITRLLGRFGFQVIFVLIVLELVGVGSILGWYLQGGIRLVLSLFGLT